MSIDAANVQAEFNFIFAGGIRIVGMASEKIQKGAAERLYSIPIGAILRGGIEGANAERALRCFAGEMFGRVVSGGYDRRKFRARGALRSLLSAVEYAEWGMGSEALASMREALREAGEALAR